MFVRVCVCVYVCVCAQVSSLYLLATQPTSVRARAERSYATPHWLKRCLRTPFVTRDCI